MADKVPGRLKGRATSAVQEWLSGTRAAARADSCLSCSLGGPAFGLVFEQDGFGELFDHGLFGGVEVGGGFEGEFGSPPRPK
jgi:hypothetical protein